MLEEPRSAPNVCESAAARHGLDEMLEHGDFLHRMVQGLLGDSHDSDDVVQQTWLAVLTTSSDAVRKPKTWLAKIAKNRSIDLIRRRRVRRVREQGVELPTPGPGPDEELELDSVRTKVAEAVGRLAEPYRTSIELRFFEGLPPREVARRMGVPVETARTRIKRALAALRTRLDGDFPEGRRAWVTALLRLEERIRPPVAPAPRAWKPVAAAAGLLALLCAGGPQLPTTPETTAAAPAAREPARVVLSVPDVPGWNDEATGERRDALGEDRWEAWPPVPAVEVQEILRRRHLREHPLQGATWGALRARPTRSAAAAPSASRPASRAPLERAEEQAPARAFGTSLATAVASSIDEDSPLDVGADERLVPGMVWVVDPSGAGDFTDLAAAAAGAREGDVLLLAGNGAGYDGLRLRGKGLSLLGRGETPVEVRGLWLRDLAANQNFVARNVAFRGVDGQSAMDLEDVRGSVWIEECTVSASDADGIVARRASALTLIRTEVTVEVTREPVVPLTALRATAADISLLESQLVGHPGTAAGPGGHGAVVTLGRLFAMSTRFAGGDGGGGTTFRGGDGGVGLWSEGEARTLGCTFEAGAGGPGPGGEGTGGLERYGVIEDLGGPLRTYRAEAIAGSAGSVRLETRGVPGDIVMSVVGSAPSKGYLLLHQGTRLVAPPYAFVIEGVIGADGRLEKQIEIPTTVALGGGFERFYAQGFFFDTAGEAWLASASTVFLLD